MSNNKVETVKCNRMNSLFGWRAGNVMTKRSMECVISVDCPFGNKMRRCCVNGFVCRLNFWAMVAEMIFTWLYPSKRIGTALFSMRAIEVNSALEVRNSIGGATNGYVLRGIVLTCNMEPHCYCCYREVSGTNWILPAVENPVVLARMQDMKVFPDVMV